MGRNKQCIRRCVYLFIQKDCQLDLYNFLIENSLKNCSL